MDTRRIRISAAVLLAASFVAALVATGPAQATPEGLFATVKDQGFAPVIVAEGETARFANLDGATHMIASAETDANGDPIFWSDVLGTGEVGPVYGIENLAARADTYHFYCPFHGWMTGTLVVSGVQTTN